MSERVREQAAPARAEPSRRASPSAPRIVRPSTHLHELHAIDAARRRGGAPVPQPVRGSLERRLGADFAVVRLHRGADVDAVAAAVDATALTNGADIFLHRSAPDVATPAGHALLAHELVHVIQQSAGPVDGAPGPSGLIVSRPGDRHERAAVRVLEGREPAPRSPIRPRSGLVIQRQGPLGIVPAAPLLTPPPPVVVPPGPLPVDGFTVPWAGTAATTGESIAVRLGLQGARVVGQGLVTAGGAALGEGAIIAGSGVAITEGAAVVTGTVLAEGAIGVGTAVAAPAAAVVAAESVAIVGTAAVVTTGEAATVATLATTGALITPVGWIVIGVVVVAIGVGIAVYLLTRETPAPEEIVPVARVPGATRGTGKGSMAPVRAPGQGGSPVQEPVSGPPLVIPGAGGMGPVMEPEPFVPVIAPGAGAATPLALAGPLEGATDLHIYHRQTGDEITDIDEIDDGTLWEWKSAVSAGDIDAWVQENVTAKFYAYVEARNHPPLFPHYENAPIGFAFEYPPTPELAEAVWNEIARLQALHHDIELHDPAFGARRKAR